MVIYPRSYSTSVLGVDCSTSKALVGAAVGCLLAVLSLVAVQTSSDILHYATVTLYLSSALLAHLPASAIARAQCSIRRGVVLYLSTTLVTWVAVFNVVYVLVSGV